MTAPTGDGPVEQYLDEMFDRLAGTGPAGRRMLAEAESHLLAAVEDGRDRGLDAEAAEREAIARFGTVTTVVRHVPVATGEVRQRLRHLLSVVWVAAGAVLLWWGGSGVITWLLSGPWTRLLIATDRFGAQPDMCERPWVPLNPAVDCFTQYREYLNLLPHGGDRDTYPWVAVGGVAVLVAWLIVRRVTALGTPRMILLSVPFGLAALVLTTYGVLGVFHQAQNWALSYLVAGLFAAGTSVAALVNRNAAPDQARGGISR
ncbi:permease prefix domain 1-containing protein [Actinoplanes solisilvae]|uniref:permease prefix domain 1-containing protein n=1 Tax=Actinoplanes solisilvae TaxID=2486853 RepID=UPI000FDB2297|nr:permease prefix domain 1-containing protein [Actinoplanes solisilvae]